MDAAKLLIDDERFAFLCVGKGTEKARLQARAQAENISNLTFLPAIGKKQVPAFLKACDALYIGAEPCSLYRFGVSMNKVYDYMMAGKPIIYGVEAQNNDVEEAGCGLTIRPGNAEEIAEAARKLAEMAPGERTRMGECGKAWVIKNCDYTKLARIFLEIMER